MYIYIYIYIYNYIYIYTTYILVKSTQIGFSPKIKNNNGYPISKTLAHYLDESEIEIVDIYIKDRGATGTTTPPHPPKKEEKNKISL